MFVNAEVVLSYSCPSNEEKAILNTFFTSPVKFGGNNYHEFYHTTVFKY